MFYFEYATFGHGLSIPVFTSIMSNFYAESFVSVSTLVTEKWIRVWKNRKRWPFPRLPLEKGMKSRKSKLRMNVIWENHLIERLVASFGIKLGGKKSVFSKNYRNDFEIFFRSLWLCTHCDLSFSNASVMNLHVLVHNDNGEEDNTSDSRGDKNHQQSPSVNEDLHECPQCSMVII